MTSTSMVTKRGGSPGVVPVASVSTASPLPKGPMPSHFSTLTVAPASISMTAAAMTIFFTAQCSPSSVPHYHG